ncbi:hypothetical protein CAP35_15360 [Chitinophagaceae bacterium IBVUCB1]|nr:hypothetical protein CAP35_15360 [Chitinophagaceae bacterium IBVUCB1]
MKHLSKHLLTLIAFLIPALSNAQNKTIHEFKLRNKSVITNDSIGYIRVIDVRIHKADIGYVYDYSTRKCKLVTESSLDTSLALFMNKHFISNANGSDTVLCIVRDLYADQRPTNNDAGTVYINIDFFRGKNNQYKLVFQADSLHILPYNLPKSLFITINEQISYLSNLALKDSLYSAALKIYSKDDAVSLPSIEKSTLPLYNITNHSKGIYFNYQQMTTLNPSIKDFKPEIWSRFIEKKIDIYQVMPDGELGDLINKDSIYALYDDGWWVYTFNAFYEAQLINNDYYIKVPIENIFKEEKDKAYMAYYMGGMFAGATASILNKTFCRLKINHKTGKLTIVKLVM